MINPPDPNGSLICASRLQTLQKCEETEIRWSKTSHSFSETNLDPARLPFIRWSCWCFWILTILKFTVRTFLPLSAHVQVVTSFMTTSHPGQRKRLCRWTTIIHYNTIMCHRETWPVFFRNCFESHPHVAQFQPHPLNLVELFAAKQGLPLSNHGPPSPIHVGLWRGCCLTRGWVVWKNMSCVVHQCSSVRPMEEVQHMGHTFRFHSDLFCAQLLQVDDGRWWFPSFARLKPY